VSVCVFSPDVFDNGEAAGLDMVTVWHGTL